MAERDVLTAVELALKVMSGNISVSDEELTEVYYILWKWGVKAPENEMVKKVLKQYHEKFFSSKEFLDDYVEMRSTIDKAIARSNSFYEMVDNILEDLSYMWENIEEEVSKVIWDLYLKD